MPRAKKVTGDVLAPFACWRCGKKLAEQAGPGTEAKCMRCGARNIAPTEEQAAQIFPASERTKPSRLAEVAPTTAAPADEGQPPPA